MKFGLSKEEFKQIEQMLISPLKKHNAKLWCFGSRARGDHNQFSDLDIMIDAPNDLGVIISEISEKLQNSNFPFKVDIVQKSNFATSYLDSFEKDKKAL